MTLWPALGAAAIPAAGQKASSHIDAHVHVSTPDIVHFPRNPEYAGQQFKPDSFTPEQ